MEWVGAHTGPSNWACCGWAFVGGRKGAAQRLEDRGRREQAGRCGPKVRWAAARPAGQKKQARGEETGAGRLVGLQPEREREGKILFFYFKTYFKTILKAI